MRSISRAASAAVLFFLSACTTSAQPSRQLSPSDVVATVGPARITLAEVDERALTLSAASFGGGSLAQALYEARSATLSELIASRLIDEDAKANGIDRAMMIEREITAKVAVPTEMDVIDWYRANPARVQGATLDQVGGPIRQLLLQERTGAARQEYLDGLKAKTAVEILLEPPRLVVADAGRPAKGPADAPVQIIEFSDFECPFCQRSSPTIAKVLANYGDRIRLVYRHYPLPNHPNARPAAEASACAAELGAFWRYHDRLFENQARLAAGDLKQHAADLGLEPAAFNECFDSRKYRQDVDADMAAGEAAGVSGTPAFFINGRPLTGAQPFEAFQRIIDEELARKKR